MLYLDLSVILQNVRILKARILNFTFKLFTKDVLLKKPVLLCFAFFSKMYYILIYVQEVVDFVFKKHPLILFSCLFPPSYYVFKL